ASGTGVATLRHSHYAERRQAGTLPGGGRCFALRPDPQESAVARTLSERRPARSPRRAASPLAPVAGRISRKRFGQPLCPVSAGRRQLVLSFLRNALSRTHSGVF